MCVCVYLCAEVHIAPVKDSLLSSQECHVSCHAICSDCVFSGEWQINYCSGRCHVVGLSCVNLCTKQHRHFSGVYVFI